MTELSEFDLDSLWEDSAADEEPDLARFDDGNCSCHGCKLPVADGGKRCEFCEAHCPKMIGVRPFEKSVLGILAWRTHLVRDVLDDLGVDPVEWWPFVLSHGTFDRAMRAHEECRQMDYAFERAMANERA